MIELGTAATVLLLVAVCGVATLYSAVGHGGATGYLAVMGLLSVPSAFSRPGALWLNCFVAAIAFWRFSARGCFDWKIFVPLASVSIPMAWFGSQMHLGGSLPGVVLAFVLASAGVFMFLRPIELETLKQPQLWILALAGGALGFLAGLTGIGGGVFLTPLLILSGWALPKTAAGVSALFILVNSIAGLAGLGAKGLVWNPLLLGAIVLGIAGALSGSWLGAARWPNKHLKFALSVVLWIAAAKLIFTGS